MADITKREAEKIATKLGATPKAGGKHMKVKVYVDDILETIFGFSHSLRKGNRHIPGQLGLSASDTRDLARPCIVRLKETSGLYKNVHPVLRPS